MYNLFLDDEITPQWAVHGGLVEFSIDLYRNGDWVIVRNYDEFVQTIEEKGIPTMISFDHDLADIVYDNGKISFSYKEHTGYDCAKWLVDYIYDNNLKLPNYQVHSGNPVGKKNIQDYLANASKHLNIWFWGGWTLNII